MLYFGSKKFICHTFVRKPWGHADFSLRVKNSMSYVWYVFDMLGMQKSNPQLESRESPDPRPLSLFLQSKTRQMAGEIFVKKAENSHFSLLIIIFCLHLLHMGRKNIQYLVSFFFFFFSDTPCQFRISSLLMELVTCSLPFLILKRYISERIGWSVLVFWKSARLQMTMTQIFSATGKISPRTH